MFSTESLDRLFADVKFLRMLQPDSLRLGSSGDSLDHPDAIKIVEMMLVRTDVLERRRQRLTRGKEHHEIKVFTNYRPNLEEKLLAMLELASRYPKRLRVVISLPFNKNDAVNSRFDQFVRRHDEIFTGTWKVGSDGLLRHGVSDNKDLPYEIAIQDVRHPLVLFMSGRVMSRSAIGGRVSRNQWVEADREIMYRDRGLVKTVLNPDALWLMIYATMYESHTSRVFTPLNQNNLEVFSYLGWHHDFPTPPNWPGGKGKLRSWPEARKLKKNAERSKRNKYPVTVVR